MIKDRCGNNNKDDDNNPKTLNDKNQQASSQKFRQLKDSSVSHTDSKYFSYLKQKATNEGHLVKIKLIIQ